jgi:hypothetical protein
MTSQRTDPQTRPGLTADLRDAVSLRTAALVFATLLLQLGFTLSYVGALHGSVSRGEQRHARTPGDHEVSKP